MRQVWTLTALLLMCVSVSFAQLKTPQPSPYSTTSQVVGLTEISLNWSAPALKGRAIWGELVPYDEVWRLGANSPSQIVLKEDVTIEGKKIPAGTYAIFAIPTKKEWTIIINSDYEQWGAGNYDEKKDLHRFTKMPQEMTDPMERLTFMISSDVENEAKGTISFQWDRLRISFTIETDVKSAALASVKSATADATRAWYTLSESARMYLEYDQDLEQALKWADMAVAMNEHFYSRWIRAQVLAAQGKNKEAILSAEEALRLGKEKPSNFFNSLKEEIEGSMKKWK